MMKTFRLTAKEWKELARLSSLARNTPLMMVGSVNMSAAAYDDVRRAWERIADKYGFVVDSVRQGNESRREIEAEERSQ